MSIARIAAVWSVTYLAPKRCRALGHFEKQCCAHVFYNWRINIEKKLLVKDALAYAAKASKSSTQLCILKEWKNWALYHASCQTNVHAMQHKKNQTMLKHGFIMLK